MNDEVYKDAQKVNLITLLRTFKREGLENFIVIRRNKFENLLKENKELRKNSVPVAKIEEEIKHLHKNIQDIENVTLFKEKTLKEQTEIELCKYAICVLTRIWEGK